MSAPVIVVKIGGSVLVDDGAFGLAVDEIGGFVGEGARVVAVVSAREGTTDRLIARLDGITETPDCRLRAAFLATGELRSAAALAIAADAAGIPTALLQPHELALAVASGDDPGPVGLGASALRDCLESHSLVVVPGFVGLDATGSLTLLGRGGSDLTAIFLAAELGAELCVLVKDVDGWFTGDPRLLPDARRFRTLHWLDAIAQPSPIVQDRAVRTALDLGVGFQVRTWGSDRGTWVGSEATATEPIAVEPTAGIEPARCACGAAVHPPGRCDAGTASGPDLLEARP